MPHCLKTLRLFFIICILPLPALAQTGGEVPPSSAPVPGWPSQVQAVTYLSTADNTQQPTLFYKPPGDQPAPLLVALHTWGSDYRKPPEAAYAKWCIAKGWVLVHPNFRGPNNNPSACGSDLVVQDIVSVVEYAKANAHVDPDRIYLVGVSGGAHLSMLMAGRAPGIWAGVSEWCGISDLKAWYAQGLTRKKSAAYPKTMAEACGGAPGASPEVDAQYLKRSGISTLAQAKDVPIDFNTGIFDGHKGSVPDSQSLNAFNILAAPGDRLSDADIAFITEKSQIPQALQQPLDDPLYARGQALFRRTSGNARVTVFKGGHEILFEAALNWLEQQRKGRPAVWDIKPTSSVDLNSESTEAGK